MMRGAARIAAVLLLTVAPVRATVPAPATGEDAYRHLLTYTGLGLHRSGTVGDEAVATWIASEFDALGLQTQVQEVRFPRYVPTNVSLTVGPLQPAVFPLFYSGRTGPAGVAGPLVPVGAGTPGEFAGVDVSGKVVLIEAPLVLNFTPPTLAGALTAAAKAGALGAVVAVQGPGNEIVAQNVDARAGLCSFPTVVVGKRDGMALRALAGGSARLVLEAEYQDGSPAAAGEVGRTSNVTGFLRGSGDNVIVIGTPLNGWFTTGGERGPGVGTLLTLARFFAGEPTPPPESLLFVGFGGHEVGFLGIERFIEEYRALMPRVTSFVFMGAAIAAKEYDEVGDRIVETGAPEENRAMFISENPLLEAIGMGAMTAELAEPMAWIPPRALNPGEQRFMYEAHVPIVSISGAHIYYHTPRDLPDTTTPELLDPVVAGFRRVVELLLSTDAALIRGANAVASAIAPTTPPGVCPG